MDLDGVKALQSIGVILMLNINDDDIVILELNTKEATLTYSQGV